LDAHDIEKGFVLLISLVLVAGISYVGDNEGLSSITGEAISFAEQCDSENTLLRLSSADNGHAQLVDHGTSDEDYPISVCEDAGPINIECGENNEHTVLWLSSPSNTHVAKTVCDENGCRAAEEPYTLPVCYDNKFCIYASSSTYNDCGGLSGDNVECFGSISGSSNAHVADCNVFGLNICCGDNRLPSGGGSCDINDISGKVYWAKDSNGNQRYVDEEEVESGTSVWVFIDGGADCANENLESLEIFEEDLIIDQLIFAFSEGDRNFDDEGKIARPWGTIWVEDASGDPEFYVNAKIDGDGERSDLIRVFESDDDTDEECNRNGICEPDRGEDNLNCARDNGGDCFCGDGVIAPLELCDIGENEGTDDDILPKNKNSCSDHGPWSNGDGKLRCSQDCKFIDTNACECNEDDCR